MDFLLPLFVLALPSPCLYIKNLAATHNKNCPFKSSHPKCMMIVYFVGLDQY